MAAELEEELTCSICLDPMAAAHMLSCSHVFCKSCIHELMKFARSNRVIHVLI